MSTTFSTRQANGISAFFDSVGIPESERDVTRLVLVTTSVDNECASVCTVCGHAGIKYLFHLQDKDHRGMDYPTLIAGSNCIESYMEANGVLRRDVSSKLRALKKQAARDKVIQDRKEGLEKAEKAREFITTLAAELRLSGHYRVTRVLEMLQNVLDNRYILSEKQLTWARDVAKMLVDVQRGDKNALRR